VKNRQLWLPLLSLLTGLGLILAACGPAATESLSPLSAPTEGQVAVPSEAQVIASLVQQDLAEQLNVDTQDIRVVSIEATEWADSSLGCPKPGMMYASVLTPGYEIVLEVEGQEYVYHTGSDNFVLCVESTSSEEPAHQVRVEPEAVALVEQAQQDLSDRFGIALDSSTVLAVEAVEWPDSSLGCPQPGMMYLTVVTPGYRIKLEAGGEIYEYHADSEQAIYCEAPQPSPQGEAQGATATEEHVVSMATADLAQQLNIPADQVEMVRVEPVQWPDTSLGCPQPGMLYAQVIMPGYLIVLSAEGQEYEYHADYGQVIRCEQ
jgi:hypothetical protein